MATGDGRASRHPSRRPTPLRVAWLLRMRSGSEPIIWTRPAIARRQLSAPVVIIRAWPDASDPLREVAIVPVICPTCQHVISEMTKLSSRYCAWGCFRYFCPGSLAEARPDPSAAVSSTARSGRDRDPAKAAAWAHRRSRTGARAGRRLRDRWERRGARWRRASDRAPR